MSKLRIISIGNEKEFTYIIIKKQNNFFKQLESWIYESFPKEKFSYISTYMDYKNNYEPKKKDIRKYNEVHESYGKMGLRFDAFFSKTRVFVTIYTSLNKRKILMNNLEKFASLGRLSRKK